MRTPRPLLLVLLFTLLSSLAANAFAGVGAEVTFHVDRTDDVLGLACDGAVPNDCSLRAAVMWANTVPAAVDVVIEIPAGVFELTRNGAGDDTSIDGDLDLLRSMTLRGQGREATLISGGEMAPLDDRLIEVHAPDHFVVFESLGIVHGAPPSGLHSVFVGSTSIVRFEDCALSSHGDEITGGGALRLSYGVTAAVLEDCVLEDNRSLDVGAAISSAAHALAVRSSALLGNTAGDFGGAVYLEPPIGGTLGSTSFTGSLLDGNEAQYGGAVWADDDTDLQVSKSTFRDNRAVTMGAGDGSGGAIYSTADVTVESSTFVGNSSEDHGAAIASVITVPPQPVVDVFNTTFSANVGVAGDVAAVLLFGSAVEYLHVTSVDQPLDLATDQADVAFQNSLFAGGCDYFLNSGTSNGGNLVVDDSCWGLTPDASDQLIGDLDLGPLAPNGGPTWTHMPGPASQLLGASPVCPPSDQRDMPRPGANCTTGAVERQPNEGVIFPDGFESGDTTAWSSVVN